MLSCFFLSYFLSICTAFFLASYAMNIFLGCYFVLKKLFKRISMRVQFHLKLFAVFERKYTSCINGPKGFIFTWVMTTLHFLWGPEIMNYDIDFKLTVLDTK